ncbi:MULTISPECIES: TerC/Alx family metal homeostasis membrane protein [unclassified Aureispira]|uniref:TerC/Alx family metal homeostasis membrane protein n=1 Tax=unclassified Aureispira TaxID=2649989 RepID=UPI000695B579|nr:MULTISPECIES: TerC/Alx family metal homeostasis membrane protein [unclassified Aureispira]WMX16365.1 TerC/Alx family metal homeostasis membrane protein [Aureispira sp. CCB-E]
MIYIALLILVVLLLYIDLAVLNKKQDHPSNKKTALETLYWVLFALSFSGVLYWAYSHQLVDNPSHLTPLDATFKYLTGYLIELSLSVDNLFVMAFIFSSLKIPVKYQHRVLFWGIMGAMFFRAALIFPGTLLINKISWMTYVFGAFLIYTAFKMLTEEDENEAAPSSQIKFIERFVPLTTSYNGEKFWLIEDGIRKATPLFSALVVIEITDILFALDSIPAILAITTDPFIVFSSNIFAILGLRAMYFFLVNMLEQFYYIKYSVFAILLFVGIKLIIIHYIHLPEWFSLAFIVLALIVGIAYSMTHSKPSKNS